MISTVVVENEPKQLEYLIRLLTQYFPMIDIVGQASNVKDAVSTLDTCRPELVMMDIYMEPYNAFDVLDQVQSINFDIIFITGYGRDYYSKALDYSMVDYINKPVGPVSMKHAIDRVMRRREQNIHNNPPQRITPQLPQLTQKMLVRHATGKLLLDIKNILYAETKERLTYIYFEDNTHIASTDPLKRLEEHKLNDASGFYRANNRQVINALHITALDTHENTITLQNGQVIEVTRRKWSAFMKWMDNLGW